MNTAAFSAAAIRIFSEHVHGPRMGGTQFAPGIPAMEEPEAF